VGSAGGPGDAGDDTEDGCQPVVGAVDDARDPARTRPVPLLASQDPIEPAADLAVFSIGRRARRLQATELPRMPLFVVADRGEDGVSLGVAGGPLVAVVDLDPLVRLHHRQHPVRRS